MPVIGAGTTATICAGSSTTLTATGGTTYSWLPGTGLSATTGASVSASPATSTTYTVTGTSAAGCSNTATVMVSVNALPVISSGASLAICSGQSAALTAMGGIAYSWLPGTGLSATTGAAIMASPTSTTTYTVTGSNAAGCTSTATTTVTVNPLAGAGTIVGATGVCNGSSTTLSNPTAPGGVWSASSGVATIGSASGIVTGMGMGAVTISYTVTNIFACVSVTTSVMNVEAIPGFTYTLSGNGTAASTGDGGPAYLATMRAPRAVCTDNTGNLYICDVSTNVIRKVTPAGIISTVAGNGVTGTAGAGGQATAAQLSMSGGGGIYADASGNLYIANTFVHTIEKVTAATGIITVIAGNGTSGYSGDGAAATAAKISSPMGLCGDAAGNIYFADMGSHRIRKITPSGIISTIIGTGSAAFSGDGGPGTAARVNYPKDVATDNNGNLYIGDASNNVVRKYVIATGIITTVAGTGAAGNTGDGGAAVSATFSVTSRVAVDRGNNLYICDQNNNKVRQVNMNTGIVTSVAFTGANGFSGDGGPSTSATLFIPGGIACDQNGYLYISDCNNRRVRIANVGGSLRITLAGPTSVPVGTPITFTAYSAVTGSNATLQWQKNGINVSGATSTTYTNPSPVNGDVYRCILTVTPECGTATTATSNSIALAVYRAAPEPNTVSTANANVSLTAYPNPARESMIVAAEGIDNGVVTLTMFDQTGKIVMSRETTATNNKLSEAIDMQSVAPGLYIISVRDASGNVARLKCVKGQ